MVLGTNSATKVLKTVSFVFSIMNLGRGVSTRQSSVRRGFERLIADWKRREGCIDAPEKATARLAWIMTWWREGKDLSSLFGSTMMVGGLSCAFHLFKVWILIYAALRRECQLASLIPVLSVMRLVTSVFSRFFQCCMSLIWSPQRQDFKGQFCYRRCHWAVLTLGTVIVCMIFLWDYIITFGMEVNLMWKSNWTFMKVLYLFQCYLTFRVCSAAIWPMFLKNLIPLYSISRNWWMCDDLWCANPPHVINQFMFIVRRSWRGL